MIEADRQGKFTLRANGWTPPRCYRMLVSASTVLYGRGRVERRSPVRILLASGIQAVWMALLPRTPARATYNVVFRTRGSPSED